MGSRRSLRNATRISFSPTANSFIAGESPFLTPAIDFSRRETFSCNFSKSMLISCRGGGSADTLASDLHRVNGEGTREHGKLGEHARDWLKNRGACERC